MKILIVGINYWPELTGIGKFTGELSEWLVSHGIDVRVITAPPYYPAWRIAEGYSGWRYRRETLQGVRVLRCPLWVPGRQSGLKRLLHLFSFALSSLLPTIWSSMVWRPTWIMVIEPPLLCLPGVLFAAKLSRAKAWLHVQDFEVDAAFDLGLLKSAKLRHVALNTERGLMRLCARVSTISERMMERLDRKQVPAASRLLFPNWVDTNAIAPIEGPNRLREQLDVPESKIVLLYSGNMGEKQGLDVLLDVAERLAGDPKYLLIMCGDGAAKARLELRAKSLQNVRFMPLQPLEQFNELLNLADIHVLPQRADAEDLVMPSKLTAMFASGKPVITTARPGSQVATVVAGRGEVVPPDDCLAFQAAVERLGNQPERRHALGMAGRHYAESHWAKEVVLQKILVELRLNVNKIER